MANHTRVIGVRISRRSLSETLEAVLRRVSEKRGGFACFVNVHLATEYQSNPALRSALDEAWLNAADGVPLKWVSRLKGQAVRSRVCGPDFFRLFLETQNDYEMAFLGSTPSVLKALASHFGLSHVPAYSPPIRGFSVANAKEDWEALLDRCPGRRPPAVVWVGLGAPKQELWMQAVSRIAPQTLFFGVGAAFDFLSGNKPRAPKWMQRAGLEWLHRLGSEPGRLWRRYLTTNTRFVWLATRDILGSWPPGRSG
ncbi:MAG: WecB/TagA/CpsF family glycosyltransferase [Bacteriovoracia bacterium]